MYRIPAGYSFNLDGTAIYLTLASMFIAQACDITLSWTQIGAMLGLMLLTSKGAAGVTGSGFRRAGGDVGGDAGPASGRRGADRRYRPIHVRGARTDQHHEQRGRLHRRVHLGKTRATAKCLLESCSQTMSTPNWSWNRKPSCRRPGRQPPFTRCSPTDLIAATAHASRSRGANRFASVNRTGEWRVAAEEPPFAGSI
jgi:hypothetical protein